MSGVKHSWTLLVLIAVITAGEAYASFDRDTVESLVRQWAPMVWLAPGEQFMPGNVNDFLRNVHAEKSTVAAASVLHQTADILDVSDDVLLYELDREIGRSEAQNTLPPPTTAAGKGQANRSRVRVEQSRAFRMERVIDLPIGKRSLDWFLTANADVDVQLEDAESFLYGQDPNRGKVPIYAVVNVCDPMILSDSENDIDSFDRTARTAYIPINSHGRTSHLRTRNNASGRSPMRSDALSLGTSFPINITTVPVNKQIPPAHRQLPERIPQFHVTYWMFYPYNQGKTICTLNLGPLGRLPIPQLFGKCLGTRRDFGSHVGDWEHMTLHFRAANNGQRREPSEMYVSAHDAGAYYTFDRMTGSFDFRRQETRNNHILQQPIFPKTVRTVAGNHPVLFSARGSHGLWTAPGQHRFVRVPRLVDVNGFGTPWYTWKNIEFAWDYRQSPAAAAGAGRSAAAAGGMSLMDGPEWLQYMGRWGNAKSKCHPLKRLGLHFCEYNDGPTGIPLKELHFGCSR